MGPIRTEVRTPRLKLRPPESRDALPIAGLINDFDVVRMMSRVPWPYSLADAEAFVALARGMKPDTDHIFAVEHPAFGPIGVLGLTREEDGSTELGYWLGRTFWGKGFATEAAAASLHWAAESWGRRAVVAGHYADNPASGAVLCKAGFLYTGEVRRRYSLARREIVPTRMMVWLA